MSEAIPAPTYMSNEELSTYKRDMAALDRDSRTTGSANRPRRLVERVIADAKKAGTY
jgi:hypothetical protein